MLLLFAYFFIVSFIAIFYTQVFAGNNDSNSIVKHYLNPPIRARYIRFRPTDWNNHISMRVELYGC